MGCFFKICSNLGQNWLKLKKILENQVILLKIWPKIGPHWYMNWSHFLEKLVFVWVSFQILWWHIPTKTKLKYLPPPGQKIVLLKIFRCAVSVHFVSNSTYDFTRFGFTENHTPQDHFRCAMVCCYTPMPYGVTTGYILSIGYSVLLPWVQTSLS